MKIFDDWLPGMYSRRRIEREYALALLEYLESNKDRNNGHLQATSYQSMLRTVSVWRTFNLESLDKFCYQWVGEYDNETGVNLVLLKSGCEKFLKNTVFRSRSRS